MIQTKRKGCCKTNHPATKQPYRLHGWSVQHRIHGSCEAQQSEARGDIKATVERMHRIFVFIRLDDEDADDTGNQINRVNDERKQDALDAEDGIQNRAQNHGADVLGGSRFEQVGSAACAIAHIVAYKIGDNG